MAWVSKTLNIENVVTPTDDQHPLTGIWATEDSEDYGWVWDKRLLPSDSFAQTRYDTFLGGHFTGLQDGTWLEQWQSGSRGGLAYKSLMHLRNGDVLTWTPQVETGRYGFYFDTRPLFSDYSGSFIFSNILNDDGLMQHELHEDAVYETIHCVQYMRNERLDIFEKHEFVYVDEFTGLLSGGSRIATVDSNGNLIPANIETRKSEYLIEDNCVILNRDASIVVGNESLSDFSATYTEPEDTTMEYKGQGQLAGRQIFCDYFPLARSSVKLYSLSSTNVLTEWIEVDSLDFSSPTDLHYSVDYDLGTVTTGGFQAPDLTLADAILDSDTEIDVYLNEDSMKLYPDQGVIIIENEKIAYYGKGRKSFLNCIRGYDNTMSVAHAKGTVVEDRQHGLGTIDYFFVGYTSVPRIEYEVTSYGIRTANASPWLDIQPSRNIETNNILQILSADISLESIVLETDSELIGGTLYGPIYYGSDISRLTARALDGREMPIDNIPLTIEIIQGAGLLNGQGSTYTSISNTLGEIYCFYNSPYDRDNIEQRVTDTDQIPASPGVPISTEMTVNGLHSGVSTDDVWVFQVLKHDKRIGTIGLERTILGSGLAPPYNRPYIDIDGVIDEEDFRGGQAYFVVTSTRYSREIYMVETLIDTLGTYYPTGVGSSYSRIYFSEIIPTITPGQSCWLLEPDATEYSSAEFNGVRVILYEWKPYTEVEHPLDSRLPGAYYPLHPDSVSGQKLIFYDRHLPIPAPNDNNTNLAGYVVIAPGEVKVQAHGTDPATGHTIYSNIIRLSLELPQILIGVDMNESPPIPYGWSLVRDDFNIGSALGGANFITINPRAMNISQFTVTGES